MRSESLVVHTDADADGDLCVSKVRSGLSNELVTRREAQRSLEKELLALTRDKSEIERKHKLLRRQIKVRAMPCAVSMIDARPTSANCSVDHAKQPIARPGAPHIAAHPREPSSSHEQSQNAN